MTETKRPAWEWVLAWLLLPAFLLDVSVRRLASWLALSIAVELVVLVVLLFGLEIRFSPWWGVLGAVLLADLVGWIIRFQYIGPLFDFVTHGVTALGRAGERSAASLEQLKSTRERVRDDLAADGEEVEPLKRVAQDKGSIPLASARSRFDVGAKPGAEPVGDLDEALGGAKGTAPPPKKHRPPAQDGETGEDESATSRLLRAKKRAQREREENK